MAIRRCPTCGSRKIRRQTVVIKATVHGKKSEVPDLELEVCPDCGERLFDLARIIQEGHSNNPGLPDHEPTDGRTWYLRCPARTKTERNQGTLSLVFGRPARKNQEERFLPKRRGRSVAIA
jgi:YgiT-type zinc finger domain-containing protein